MFTHIRLVGLLLASMGLVPFCSSQSLDMQDDFTAGISAYEKADYDQAIARLTRVVLLDPKHIEAHLYLAMSYDGKYVPNADTEYEDNGYWLRRALYEYRQVLALDPAHKGALLRMAYLLLGEAKDEESEQCYRKVLEIDAKDSEAMYLLAVINFRRAYQIRVVERANLGLSLKTPLIHSFGCYSVRSKNFENVQEGIELLERLLEFTKNGKYDIQAYLSLFYLERADIQCEDGQTYETDIQTAVKWRLASDETFQHKKREETEPTSPRWPPAPPPLQETISSRK